MPIIERESIRGIEAGLCKVVRENLKPKTYNLWPMNFSFGGLIK